MKIGNADVAYFSPVLIISFTIMLYYFSVFFLVILFIPKGILNMQYFKYISFFLFISTVIRLYFLILYKEKYKEILKRDKTLKKDNLKAILFPSIGFILFNLGWILKMLQNQGRI